ncbi:hypothetical protein [Streptomyces sp. NPDC048111]|uniref:hypothetical protein n=1 Tax=Streptomyces sp. NPDC048111 TaxID=3365500 RepID=UPI00371B0B76
MGEDAGRTVELSDVVGAAVVGDRNTVYVTQGSAPAVRSAYWEHVRRMAPSQLVGREAELAELAKFCRADSTPGYAWWRADAWAGKTALLAWFALHPPEGVRVVPFFVTARSGAQNDVVAYVDVVLEQLAELTGEALPAFLPATVRAAHLLALYERAARICAERRERLVLLVDGLDEDHGVHTGPDAHSIASLLPMDTTAGLWVLCAGRLNPPLPPDVAHGHPLRSPDVVRLLTPSPSAKAIRHEAERELKSFLTAGDLHRALLGLIVAAGGGLTMDDLARLTGATAYEVKDLLRSKAGRTFSLRRSASGTEGEDARSEVVLLGHEELQRQAVEMLGHRALDACRDQLHDWFAEHRRLGWPASTPEYLMRGYFLMLRMRRDVERMLLCAGDDALHRRMRDATGGDAEAVEQIRATEELLDPGQDDQLLSLLRLAIKRTALTERIERTPLPLPVVWVALGDEPRARRTALALPEPHMRVSALIDIADELGRGGERDREVCALTDAADAARELPQDVRRDRQLGAVCLRLIRAGRCADAMAVAGDVQGSWVLPYPVFARRVVEELARAGQPAYVGQALTRHRISDVRAAHVRATAFARNGDFEAAERAARSVELARGAALLEVAAALRRAGLTARAEQLIHEARAAGPGVLRRQFIEGLVELGDVTEGLRLITDALAQGRGARTGILLLPALARAGEFDGARAVLRRLRGLDFSEGVWEVARACALSGEVEAAMRFARLMSDATSLSDVLGHVAGAMVRRGEVERGLRIARLLAEQDDDPGPLVSIAAELGRVGLKERAVGLVAEAHLLHGASPASEVEQQAEVSAALAAAGWCERAEAALEGIEDRLHAALGRLDAQGQEAGHLLLVVLRALASVGHFERAEVLAHLAPGPQQVELLLGELVRARADAGSFDEVERLGRTQAKLNGGWLAVVAAARAAERGAYDTALKLAECATLQGQAGALADIARCLHRDGREAEAATLLARAASAAGFAPSVRASAALARAFHQVGDREAAHLHLSQAEVVVGFTRAGGSEVGDFVRALVSSGQAERAENLVERVRGPAATAAQVDLVAALAESGERPRAYARAGGITSRAGAATALAALAHWSPAPEARTLLAEALRRGSWVRCLPELVRHSPEAALVAAQEVLGARPDYADLSSESGCTGSANGRPDPKRSTSSSA